MAHAITYGSATHYKASASRGHTRVFAGNYEFNLIYSYELVGREGGREGGREVKGTCVYALPCVRVVVCAFWRLSSNDAAGKMEEGRGAAAFSMSQANVLLPLWWLG